MKYLDFMYNKNLHSIIAFLETILPICVAVWEFNQINPWGRDSCMAWKN